MILLVIPRSRDGLMKILLKPFLLTLPLCCGAGGGEGEGRREGRKREEGRREKGREGRGGEGREGKPDAGVGEGQPEVGTGVLGRDRPRALATPKCGLPTTARRADRDPRH